MPNFMPDFLQRLLGFSGRTFPQRPIAPSLPPKQEWPVREVNPYAGLAPIQAPQSQEDFTDMAKLWQILNANRNKQFVQRILNPQNYPMLNFGGGEYGSHRISSGRFDNRELLFPLIRYEGNQLNAYEFPEAAHRALQTGEYIPFQAPEEADWFANSYKKAWGE